MAKRPLSTTAGVILGTLVGVLFFLGGYLLCVGDHTQYGEVMFLMVPFVSGFAVAAVVRSASLLAACSLMTCIIGLVMLIATGFEGYLCCLMALPLVAAGIAIGAIVGHLVRGRFLDNTIHPQRNTLMLLAIGPFLMTAAHRAEQPWIGAQRFETFESEVDVPAPPVIAWQLLERMPTMDGAKPFLLRVGLPVPYQCNLDRDAVGGRRTCLFNQGMIEQEVTEWREPQAMALAITKSTLPGRKWLTFVAADYELRPTANGTTIIRRTKIASRLYPRWYWRPFEAWGVESEHAFVLDSIKIAAESR